MKNLLLWSTLLGLLAWSGCKPEPCIDHTNPACENYDPCWDQAPVSAAFHMYERGALPMPDGWIDYDTDTLYGSSIKFTALEDSAEYEWQLGAETIRERSFVRRGFPKNVPLTVTLIVRKSANTVCFPDDNGVDTLTRTFISSTGVDPKCFRGGTIGPIPGRYEGVFANEPTTLRQVEVWACSSYVTNTVFGVETFIRPGITGLLPNGSCENWDISGAGPPFYGYRQWYFLGSNAVEDGCFRGGFLVFQPEGTDSILINYQVAVVDLDTSFAYQFRGKRIY